MYLLTYDHNDKVNLPVHYRSLIRGFIIRMKKLCILDYQKCVQWRFWSDRKCAGWFQIRIFVGCIFLTFYLITKTCLYNFDPLKPHCYIVKLGLQGYTLFFLFLLKNIHSGYSSELPRGGGSDVYPQSMFKQKYEIYQSFIYLKIVSFWRWNFLYIWVGVFS